MTIQTLAAPSGLWAESFALSAEDARRRANSYLVSCVSTGYRGINPELVPFTPPIWQLIIQYKVPTLPPIRVGFLEVNAQTGEVIPLSPTQIEIIRERACAYLTANTPSTAIPH